MKLLGIDLGGTNIRAGVVEGGTVRGVVSERITSTASELEVCDQVYDVVQRSLEAGVTAMGIGVPSVVDVKRGIVYNVQNIPSWKQVPIKERLEQRFGIPVHVNNDANCFVVGERTFGQGRGYRDIVGLILGTGLGAGLVLDGKLYPGANAGAGEFGMLPYRGDILESFCSGQFFRRRCGEDGEVLARRVGEGDEEALRVFEEFGTHVGRAISMIVLTIDPEIIILGGSVSRSYSFFQSSVWSILRSFPYPETIARLKVVPSNLEHAGILGAAALYYESQSGVTTVPESRASQ